MANMNAVGRPQREGAVKVTVTFNREIVNAGKMKALSKNLSFSDYVQDLVAADLHNNPITVPEIKTDKKFKKILPKRKNESESVPRIATPDDQEELNL